jgi:hypothetical protein
MDFYLLNFIQIIYTCIRDKSFTGMGFGFRGMVFNATLNNISVWMPVLLMEETVPGENHRPAKLFQIMLYQVNLARVGFELKLIVVIGTDIISSYKSNYHMITTTTAPD